jgi:putative ABC transport system ATP-binding protein
MSILELKDLSYTYDRGKTFVFKDLTYDFEPGKVYAIVGRSGAGKTTLLSLLSGLCSPTGGTISINGQDITLMDKYDYRSKYVGVIFQAYNLLPKLTALENVILSIDISGIKCEDKKKKALDLLCKTGLDEDEVQRRVLKLSGGEQQRVAIARALSYDPQIILADEPTGNLDVQTQEGIMDIFCDLAHNEGKCVIIVTHSPDVEKRADEIYHLEKQKKTIQKKTAQKKKIPEKTTA